MKARSGHIIFAPKVKFSDLEPVCKELLNCFLEETKQFGEDPEFVKIVTHCNMLDLRANRKPEGFNRVGNMRLIFPIKDNGDRIEFYVYQQARATEVPRITALLSKVLHRKGLSHEIEWDRMLLYRDEK